MSVSSSFSNVNVNNTEVSDFKIDLFLNEYITYNL